MLRFQSTPPRRWWPAVPMELVIAVKFQSTPPRRWWHKLTPNVYALLKFQSTPPRRWWPSWDTVMSIRPWFQSTPPRRWWRKGYNNRSKYAKFQSTPPRRWWQQIYTTIHTYIRQFSYKSFTATPYHLQTLQIHPKNTNYSWFPRCEPPRGFMGTSHSHGRIWKLKVIQNICFTPLFMDSIIVKAHQHNVGAEKGIIRSNWP